MERDFLNTKIDELIKRAEEPEQTSDIRFSVTFSKFNNRRIEYARRKLKMTKQELISDIVMAAISDIEKKLGLLTTDPETNEIILKKDYASIIRSNKTISSYFKEKE